MTSKKGIERPHPETRILLLITAPKLAEKARALFDQGRVPFQYQFHGQGTASSEIMEALGLGSVEKILLMCALPRRLADEMMKKLRRELRLSSTNSGIAVTLPISGGSGRLLKQLGAMLPEGDAHLIERSHFDMSDCAYVLILTIVDRGFSEDVMHAARGAGASGGTVVNSRRIVNEETMRFWGMDIQQEREAVIIVAESACKGAIMKAISASCGIHSEAHGLVLSMPVDQVIGLD